MKKCLLPILLLIMFMPLIVNAESKYLYDVLKEEAESGGLAREYTGEHHDSFIEDPSKSIYYYATSSQNNSSQADQVLEKGNVIFANQCWFMLRTTDTGGVKLIHNGEPSNGKCLNSTSYKKVIVESSGAKLNASSTYAYSDSFTYDLTTGKFKLNNGFIDSSSTVQDRIGKFTCAQITTNATCNTLYYITSVVSNSNVSVIQYKIDYNYGGVALLKYNYNGTTPTYVGYKYGTEYKINSMTWSSTREFGSSVTWDGDKYLLNDSTTIVSTLPSEKRNILSTHHYFCTDSSCKKVGYVFFYNEGLPTYNKLYYIIMDNGIEDINQVLTQMFKENDIDSNAKLINDIWYESNLLNYSNYLEDTIFCNDRSFLTTGNSSFEKSGWNPNGGDTTITLNFRGYNTLKDLSCLNREDQFSIYNEKAQLKYPIGLSTAAEYNLMNNYYVTKSFGNSWLLTPHSVDMTGGYIKRGYGSDITAVTLPNESYTLRPVISLKYGIEYSDGNGSKETPYIVRILNKSNIIINNDDNMGTVSNIDNITNVEELSEVAFNVSPLEGYIVKTISIKDANDNDITYLENDNRYLFIMPDSDVTIMPIYEKVKNSINVEIIDETKDLNINIEDLTQVEYEEEVSFKVTPIKGYKVNSIKIIDEDNNEIDYSTEDNKNYTFIMPTSDVTIIPSYERVSNSVNVDNNKNTKEIIIEVNDVSAVVYEDKVKFTVTPEEGYEVDTILITDSDGNKVEYKKTNKENEYEFIMPDTDVVITPTYRKKESINLPDTLKNPNTGTGISIIIIVMLIISSVTYIIFKRKKNYIMK